jgi:hypothetical protein
MFQQVTKYIVQVTNILLRLFDLEINNKHIIEEKDRPIQIYRELLKRSSRSSKQNYKIGTGRIVKYW